MKEQRVTWSVLLRQSNLLTNKGQYYPQVLLRDRISVDQLIHRIVAAGSEYKLETYLAIAHRLEREIRDYLIEGYAISSSLGTLTPTVTGMWNFDRIDPEARAQNQATLNYTMSKEMKESFANPLFHAVGSRSSRLAIGRVINTRHRDVEGIASPGDYLILEGRLLLMNGELPERGIYFVDAGTEEEVAFIGPEDMFHNTRSMIHIQVPEDLPVGTYSLRVVSQCTTGPRPLKEAASNEYGGLQIMPRDEAMAAVEARREKERD